MAKRDGVYGTGLKLTRLDARHLRAALLVAEGEMTHARIAAEIGVSEQSLRLWKAADLFRAEVERMRDVIRATVEHDGIANRLYRVRAQNDRWLRMQRVIAARGADHGMRKVPGGDTGLLVRQLKLLGRGLSARVVPEYSVDTGLLAELRALEQHTAKELGQWSEKVENHVTSTVAIKTIEVIAPPDVQTTGDDDETVHG